MKTIQVRSSLFTNRSIESIVNSYQIGRIMACNLLIRGLNDTYIVETEIAKYIFRIYREGWRGKSEILYELDAINHLSKNGCQVSKPIMRKDGEWLSEVHAPEGMRYGVLFTFSKGDRPEINEENVYLIGKALANIHKATDSFVSNNERKFELNVTHLLDGPLSLITPTLEKYMKSEKYSFLDGVLSKIKADILYNDDLEYGFCHGDFHNFNMHLLGDQIEAFDFDCCSRGYRSYDIAVFLWNLKQNYPNLETSCWNQFLNGYLSEKSIGNGDLQALNQFVILRRIWFLGIILKNDDVWGTHWMNEKNLEHFLNQLEQDVEKI
ncbi:phosphotransferase enzyme family protein [Bacillus sp. CGMCC 1.16607]|uniref:phosphotransferase enzyme family protein n=1 Tax=Bacillus sp. CGMCC 1.16607 TaxID=3351842 RepID=UPI0036282B89